MAPDIFFPVSFIKPHLKHIDQIPLKVTYVSPHFFYKILLSDRVDLDYFKVSISSKLLEICVSFKFLGNTILTSQQEKQSGG